MDRRPPLAHPPPEKKLLRLCDRQSSAPKQPCQVLKEFCDKNQLECTQLQQPLEKQKGNQQFRATASVQGEDFVAIGRSKSDAKDAAASYALHSLYSRNAQLRNHVLDRSQIDQLEVTYRTQWQECRRSSSCMDAGIAKAPSLSMASSVRHPRGEAVAVSWPQQYLPTANTLRDLEIRIGYLFPRGQQHLLQEACLHASCGATNYLRLAHLGDAILHSITAAEIFRSCPDLPPHDLANLRTLLVRREDCARYARCPELDLEAFITVSVEVSHVSDAMMGEMFEAVLGAVFVASGESYRQVCLCLEHLGVLPLSQNSLALQYLRHNNLPLPLPITTPSATSHPPAQAHSPHPHSSTTPASAAPLCSAAATATGSILRHQTPQGAPPAPAPSASMTATAAPTPFLANGHARSAPSAIPTPNSHTSAASGTSHPAQAAALPLSDATHHPASGPIPATSQPSGAVNGRTSAQAFNPMPSNNPMAMDLPRLTNGNTPAEGSRTPIHSHPALAAASWRPPVNGNTHSMAAQHPPGMSAVPPTGIGTPHTLPAEGHLGCPPNLLQLPQQPLPLSTSMGPPSATHQSRVGPTPFPTAPHHALGDSTHLNPPPHLQIDAVGPTPPPLHQPPQQQPQLVFVVAPPAATQPPNDGPNPMPVPAPNLTPHIAQPHPAGATHPQHTIPAEPHRPVPHHPAINHNVPINHNNVPINHNVPMPDFNPQATHQPQAPPPHLPHLQQGPPRPPPDTSQLPLHPAPALVYPHAQTPPPPQHPNYPCSQLPQPAAPAHHSLSQPLDPNAHHSLSPPLDSNAPPMAADPHPHPQPAPHPPHLHFQQPGGQGRHPEGVPPQGHGPHLHEIPVPGHGLPPPQGQALAGNGQPPQGQGPQGPHPRGPQPPKQGQQGGGRASGRRRRQQSHGTNSAGGVGVATVGCVGAKGQQAQGAEEEDGEDDISYCWL